MHVPLHRRPRKGPEVDELEDHAEEAERSAKRAAITASRARKAGSSYASVWRDDAGLYAYIRGMVLGIAEQAEGS